MSPMTMLGIFAAGAICLAGLYVLGDLLYALGLEHGLMRHSEPRIRRRLIDGGVNVEFELDRIAAQQQRKRGYARARDAARAGVVERPWPRKRPLPTTFDPLA